MLRTTRQRAYLALVACVLWVAGIEVLPSIHLAMHAHMGAHRHEGNTIVLLDDHGRDTAETLDVDPDEPPAAQPRTADTIHARLARQLDHGHGSAAHRDLATLAPPIPLHAPLPVERRPLALTPAAIATPISRLAPRAAARGPPLHRAR
jgi:hypothetical protein